MITSKCQTWETPDYVFNPLNYIFSFDLDPCCSPETAKCSVYYTIKEDGLIQTWENYRVFCNPPYKNITPWVRKAVGNNAVLLLPARTSEAWFHDWVLPYASIYFFRSRLKFGGAKINAPFPSMLAIYGSEFQELLKSNVSIIRHGSDIP